MIMTNNSKQRIVVIGNGMVGFKFCAKMMEKGGGEQFEIAVFGEEPRPAYDRVHLSEFFSGKSATDLTLAPTDWYEENGIDLFVNEKVLGIDRESKRVVSDQGRSLSYDKLVLATGSTPFVPDIPGVDKRGVFVYRTIEDLEAIKAYGAKVKSVAVIGGGLLGLEAAKALRDLDLKTHVVEFSHCLMPRQIDKAGSQFLEDEIEALGVSVHLNKNTKAILGNGSVDGMEFADETALDVEMVVISAGIRPRDDIAVRNNLRVGKRGGIAVNSRLETSDPDIYAIGECALHNNMTYGLISPGYKMADVLTNNLLGQSDQFSGADMSAKLKLMGVDVASFGDPFAQGDDIASLTLSDSTRGVYKRLLIQKKVRTLVGGMLVGDASDYARLSQLYQSQATLPEAAESLLVDVHRSGGPEEAGFLGMPDEASVCSCENITKGQIVAACRAGAETVGAIKKCTRAGTGCGGCVPLVTDILNAEIKRVGGVVKTSICPCFDYTRVQLAEFVRTEGIRNYWEVLGRHGRGGGCEICKPAIASILASYRHDYVLDHQNIQDSNDRFLANIQKNGTYSVVPRVPGGEITPEQLIAIGEVAREFDLYTKITGGQRIDLFGARLEELPAIWERLRSVGLESGHAYAKALRTVKSCVGSTWCRFGVQDSVGLAIRIENRYKGLRAPHKIKSAVSGCSRECAEAQSKDFGVIATEKGYNLYVCGNGGMKPQHAKLLAEDLDEATLIRYVDRFLMFYIRTADKLTRTATWLNKLEGGIGRLKEVVIDDVLGICDELESEMQRHVDGYECEWSRTLNDPEMKKRFRPFVNSMEGDPSIRFFQERGQKRPLTHDEQPLGVI